VRVLRLLRAGGVLAGLTMTLPLPAVGREGSRSRRRDAKAPFTRAVLQWSLSVIASKINAGGSGSKEHMMTTEQATRVIVLQLTAEILEQLRPYMEGLDITLTLHSEWAYQEVYLDGQFAFYEKIEHRRQRLTMRGEVMGALIAKVNGALDYDRRWQPNEYKSDGFVERVRPLELIGSSHAAEGCPTCGAQILARATEVVCACGQPLFLI
jgi:hypothetical protein